MLQATNLEINTGNVTFGNTIDGELTLLFGGNLAAIKRAVADSMQDGKINLLNTTGAVVNSYEVTRPVFLYTLTVWIALLYLMIFATFDFLRACPVSFGDMTYLEFTWDLEKSSHYKRKGYLIAFTMTLYSLLIINVGSIGMGFFQTLQLVGLELAAIFMAVYGLVKPSTPIKQWNASQIPHIRFRRTLADFLFQSNDQFNVVLVEALWQAQVGDFSALDQIFDSASPESPSRYARPLSEVEDGHQATKIVKMLCDPNMLVGICVESDTEP